MLRKILVRHLGEYLLDLLAADIGILTTDAVDQAHQIEIAFVVGQGGRRVLSSLIWRRCFVDRGNL